ncbi:MAG: hypothetical protein BWK76_11150 [Desulfobulbaceae bacterium A2]|nr:MAG: hypothetical protein BWK76_11150 [Desulfobulbaceae bacterium A2]
MVRRCILVGALCCGLVACSHKPVRHLASDASLLKAGSSREEVLRYLGEPDNRRSVGPGIEELVYHEERKDTLRKTPMLGRYLGQSGNETLTITLAGDQVRALEFRTQSELDSYWRENMPATGVE